MDISDAKDIKEKIEQMRNTPGFVILMHVWNTEREKIIAEGKSGRREDKTIKMWAVLDGFDRAVHMISKLAKIRESHPENDPDLGE